MPMYTCVGRRGLGGPMQVAERTRQKIRNCVKAMAIKLKGGNLDGNPPTMEEMGSNSRLCVVGTGSEGSTPPGGRKM